MGLHLLRRVIWGIGKERVVLHNGTVVVAQRVEEAPTYAFVSFETEKKLIRFGTRLSLGALLAKLMCDSHQG